LGRTPLVAPVAELNRGNATPLILKLRFYLAVKLSPGTGRPGSLHSYRRSLAGFDLAMWEAT
jgi:hypothetical protein